MKIVYEEHHAPGRLKYKESIVLSGKHAYLYDCNGLWFRVRAWSLEGEPFIDPPASSAKLSFDDDSNILKLVYVDDLGDPHVEMVEIPDNYITSATWDENTSVATFTMSHGPDITLSIPEVGLNTAARHTHDNKSVLDATEEPYTTADKTKLDGIEPGAQVNEVTQVEFDNALALKADKSDTYTKSEVDTNIASIVDSAPGTLDTLNELAAALGDDPNFATTVATSLGNKANSSELDDKADANHTHPVEDIEATGGTSTSFLRKDGVWADPVTTVAGDMMASMYDPAGGQRQVAFADQLTATAPVDSVNGKVGAVVISKADVGLGNVDNTSDADKPVSTATQAQLNTKADATHTHDDRYYTESEIDSMLVNTSNAEPIVYDIREYGAVADGTTDCSPAIQAANAAARAAGGGIVYYPEGTWAVGYRMDRAGERTAIAPSDNVRHIGAGVGVTKVVLKDNSDANVFFVLERSYVSIENMTIDGNGDNQSGVSSGIVTDGLIVGLNVEKVKFINIQESAIKTNVDVSSQYMDSRYKDIDIDGTGSNAIFIETVNGQTENLVIDGVTVRNSMVAPPSGAIQNSTVFVRASGSLNNIVIHTSSSQVSGICLSRPLNDINTRGFNLHNFRIFAPSGSTGTGLVVTTDNCQISNGYISSVEDGLIINEGNNSVTGVVCTGITSTGLIVNTSNSVYSNLSINASFEALSIGSAAQGNSFNSIQLNSDRDGIKVTNGAADNSFTGGHIQADLQAVNDSGTNTTFANVDGMFTGVQTPTNNTDAANKEYVDNSIAQLDGASVEVGDVAPQNPSQDELWIDTGWIDIVLQSDYEPNSSYPCQVRKIGNICHMQGRIEKTSGVIQAGGDRHMANLPVGFAPSINQHIKAQCGGVTGGRLMINADGTIKCNPETNTPYVFINTSWIVG